MHRRRFLGLIAKAAGCLAMIPLVGRSARPATPKITIYTRPPVDSYLIEWKPVEFIIRPGDSSVIALAATA